MWPTCLYASEPDADLRGTRPNPTPTCAVRVKADAGRRDD